MISEKVVLGEALLAMVAVEALHRAVNLFDVLAEELAIAERVLADLADKVFHLVLLPHVLQQRPQERVSLAAILAA